MKKSKKIIVKRFLASMLTIVMVLGVVSPMAMASMAESTESVGTAFGQTSEQLFQPQVISSDEEWEMIRNIISAHYGTWDDVNTAYFGQTTQTMPNTALMGNGDLGVTSGGSQAEKIFRISKSDFWTTAGQSGGRGAQIGGVTIRAGQEDTDDLVLSNFRAGRLTATASTHHPAMPPIQAINGSVTAGSGREGWVSNALGYGGVENEWFMLEFAQPVTFNRWIYYAEAWSRPAYASRTPRAFNVQTSEDGVNWVTLPSSEITDNSEHVVQVVLDNPVTTRFVRILFIQPHQAPYANARARVSRFELFEPVGNPNLALTFSNAFATSSHGAFPPSRAVNGTVTENSGEEGWVSGGANGHGGVEPAQREALVIEFAEPITFVRWRLMSDQWGRPGASANNTARAFDLQISDGDGAWNAPSRVWETVHSVTNNNSALVDVIMDESVTTRWVRLYFHQSMQTDYQFRRARVARFELYEFAEDSAPGDDVEPDVSHFLKTQDILNSQVDVEKSLGGTPLLMETITTAEENLIITRITSQALPEALPMELIVDTWATSDHSAFPVTAAAQDDYVTVTRTTMTPHANFNNMGTRNPWRSQAAVSTRIVGTTAETEVSGVGMASQVFNIAPGQVIYVVTAVGGGGQTFRLEENPDIHIAGMLPNLVLNPEIGIMPVDQSRQLLNNVTSQSDIATLWDAHRDWWRDYWSESWVYLDTTDPRLNWLMRYYYGAQHIVGMAVREGNIAPGLYGHWVTHNYPFWDNDWHLNYNFQATWYGVYSSNRANLAIPAIEAMLSYMPIGRLRAESTEQLRRISQSNFLAPVGFRDHPLPPPGETGMINYVDYRLGRNDGTIHPTDGIQGGILFPVPTSPWGTTPGGGYYHSQTLAAPFAAYLMTEYFKYVPNLPTELLEKMFEFVEAVAIFGMNWIEELEDGSFRFMAGYNEGSWALNPAGELALYRHVFEHAALMSEALEARGVEVDGARRARWLHILENMPPAPTGYFSAGGISGEVFLLADQSFNLQARTWGPRSDPRTGDRNILQLETIVPTRVLGLFSPAEEQAIAHTTISMYGGWGANNNFAKIYPMSVRVRYPIERIVNELSHVVSQRLANNLRIVDPFHGVEKAGSTLAINSMLLQGHLGVVQVFPNWLENRDASFGRLRAPGGFIVSADYCGTEQWVSNLTVTSDAGLPMTLVHPWQDSDYNYIAVVNGSGERISVAEGTAPNWDCTVTFTFDTVAGETYWIFPAYRQEAAPVVFTGNNPNVLKELLAEGDVILQTAGNLGIFAHHSPFVIPEGRTLTVVTTLNVQGNAELIIDGRLVVQDGGRVNNQGGAGGTIVIDGSGELVNYGHVENVTNSAVVNYGTIVNNGRFEVRAGTRLHNCGEVEGDLNVHRNAILVSCEGCEVL